jgi:hypothetical protein
MLTYVETNGVDRIYTRETDRTSRQILQTAALLEWCVDHGVTLVEGGNITAPDDEDAHDMRMMKATYDKRYSSSISKKMKNAFEKAALDGRPHGGRRPFGYNYDLRTLRPDESEHYRELFARVIDGEGLVRIAKDWEQQGIVNRNGDRFSADSLKKLIRAPRAVGYRQHQGEILVGDDGAPIVGDWEPIVTPEAQLAAVASITSRRKLRTADNTRRRPRLLSSMIICGECERPMRVRYQDHPKFPPQYLCDSAKSRNCGTVVTKAEPVDKEVERRFLDLLDDPETQRVLDEMLLAEREDVSALLDAVKRYDAELLDLSRQKAEGELEPGEFRVQREVIIRNRDDAKDRLDRATDVPALLALSPAKIVADWDSADVDLDWQRQMLAAFVDVVVIKKTGERPRKGYFNPDRLVCRWRI